MGSGGKKDFVTIELDRETLTIVLENLEHFAAHYYDPHFIDITATFVQHDEVEDLVALFRGHAASAGNPIQIRLDYSDWCKYTHAMYSAKRVAIDSRSADVLVALYAKCLEMEDQGLAPQLLPD